MIGDTTIVGVSDLSTLGKIMHGIQKGGTLTGVSVKGALPIVDMRTGEDQAANAARHDELVTAASLAEDRAARVGAAFRTAASDQAKAYHGEVATRPVESLPFVGPDSFQAALDQTLAMYPPVAPADPFAATATRPAPSLYPHRPVHIDAPAMALTVPYQRHDQTGPAIMEAQRLQNLGLAPNPHAGRDGLEGVNARLRTALADSQRTARALEMAATRLRMELRATKAQLSDSPPLTQSREAGYLLQVIELTAAVTAWQRTHARHLEDVRTERQRMRHALVTALALLPADQVATALAVLPALPPSDTPADTVKP